MLQTSGNVIKGLAGMDQQRLEPLQLIQGTYPFQKGLQARLPGKLIQRILDGPIGGIYVFYYVLGRPYLLVDYGNLIIIPAGPDLTGIPPLSPVGIEWFDDFSGFDDGLISRIWGGGYGTPFPGICETILAGGVDDFEFYKDSGQFVTGVAGGATGSSSTDTNTGGGQGPSDSSPGAPNPPPGVYAQQECEMMPEDEGFIGVPLSYCIFDVVQEYGEEVITEGVPDFTTRPGYPALNDFPLVSGAAIVADVRKSTYTSGDGFGGWVNSRFNKETRVKFSFAIPLEDNWPTGTLFFLVGTKTLSTGVLDITGAPLEVTTCAALQISVQGESVGEVTLRVSPGPDGTRVVPSIVNIMATMGHLQYNSIRIYIPQ